MLGLSSSKECKIGGCCNCKKERMIVTRETGETREDTTWYYDVILQQQAYTAGSALSNWISPLPPSPASPHTVKIGEKHFESEWLQEICTREICLDFLTFEIYYDCTPLSSYWVVDSTKNIYETYYW
jgi:hypothetical protein